MSRKGFFRPLHPEKYKGNVNNIVYRSGWEIYFMRLLDNHPDIIQWSSEEIVIPYISPVDGKRHRYFPDFVIKKRTKNNEIITQLIEIKPYDQTKEPIQKKKVTRKYINEVTTYVVNKAKWDAARIYCKNQNWDFVILTEKELGIK